MRPAESSRGVSKELVALELGEPNARSKDEAGAAAAAATTRSRMERKAESDQALSNPTSRPAKGLWGFIRRLGRRAGANAEKKKPGVR